MLGALAASAASRALAQGWPERPILLVHGFPSGGPVDTVSRILADALSHQLGQPVVVEAKPGATGTAASAFVARAAPDGYTLLAVPATHVATSAMYRSLPYRPLDDFAFISTTAEYPFVIAANADGPIRTFAELIAAARGRALQYGTPGAGSLQHLSMELLARRANIRLEQIPYRGGAPAINDLLGKHIDLVIDPPTALVPLIGEDKLRGLTVTSAERFFGLPQVPTIAESGFPGFSVSGHQGLAGPARLSPEIVEKLHRAVTAVLRDGATVERLRKLGNTPIPSSPDQFKQRLAADIAQWTRLIEDANIARI